ncbi:NAD(P)/FAD-dependent oxidoreductase [Candidatus Solincola tengchongensis]|uniref:NAD(P)/FAD-dependent oxidoreductase n=1 Tax=Candidatus Solincola tengchongensis TaxID=2900693 RepID=UPI00257A230E|nr:NAD(P)/FAD-dependent oxidoreductase [Candidatus Solincola tengchongensis]
MKKYDLIVVGAGPGGCTAALTAAEAGLKTLLLERAMVPGEKNASGFALSSKAWRDFPFIREMELPSMRYCRQCVAHFLSPPPEMEERFTIASGPSRRMSYPEARDFFTVGMLRREFDPYLADLAVRAGAEMRTGSLVTGLVRENGKVAGVLLEGGEEYRAPLTIGADGVLSPVARMAGLRERWRPDQVTSVCIVDFSAPRERMDCVIHEAGFQAFFGPGLGGNFLIAYADGVHLGGPGVTNSLISRALRKRAKPARELLDTLLAPPVQRLLRALEAEPREWQAHCLTWMESIPEEISCAGLMLVGDAAGLTEPLYAEGVWQAMYSGRLAAEVAEEALRENDFSGAFLKTYRERLVESPVGQDFVAGAQLRQLFELLGDPVLCGELEELAVDLAVHLLMSGQEPKAEAMQRVFPVLGENLPALMAVARVYLPIFLRMGEENLRFYIGMAKGLRWMLKGLLPGEGDF